MTVTRVRRIPTLPTRSSDAHKGDFGRVLIVGGSVGMVGAPALSANAALRGGAGLVKIACPNVAQQTIAGLAPCATSTPLPSRGGTVSSQAVGALGDLAKQHDVVAVGPGMSQSPGVTKVVMSLLACVDGPVVVDADGLNTLAGEANWWRRCNARVILTPHPGEMQRLITGATLSLDVHDREATAIAYAQHTSAVVVLKGAGTVVTDGQRVYVNRTGNPGMATGGTGDVLTGLIAALAAQGIEPFDAAVLGVWAHGKAGDLAATKLGHASLMATDLLDHIPTALRQAVRK